MGLSKVEFMRGGYYHIYNQAAKGVELFTCEEDYNFYMRKLYKILEISELDLFCWCLISDQYHLLVVLRCNIPVDEIFKELNSAYTAYYKKKYNTTEKVFQGKMMIQSVVRTQELLQMCLNIHVLSEKAGVGKTNERRGYSDLWVWVLNNGVKIRDDVFQLNKIEYRKILNEYTQYPGNLIPFEQLGLPDKSRKRRAVRREE
jgi:REP element-mobilizing transposase RayT